MHTRTAFFILTVFLVAGFLSTFPGSDQALAADKRKLRCRISNPRCDFDGDGIHNGRERKLRIYNLRRKDTDRDGISDGDEDINRNGIDNEDEDDNRCRDVDADRDGLADEDENEFRDNPRDSDTDNDGIVDGNDDSNRNGISDEDEDDGPIGGDDDGDDEDDEDDADDGNEDDGDEGVYEHEDARFRGVSCTQEDADDSGAPVVTPAPTANPGVPPTATPSVPSGNSCDAQRRTRGFGIPSGYTGNGQTGRTLWTASCAGCHGSNGKRNTSYSNMYASRNIGSMAGVRALLSSIQNSADLTADRNCP